MTAISYVEIKLPGRLLLECELCGSIVTNGEAHTDWHTAVRMATGPFPIFGFGGLG